MDQSYKEWIEQRLKPVVELTDEEVDARIAKRLFPGFPETELKTPLSGEDKEPFKELFRMVRDTERGVMDRNNAMTLLEKLRLSEELPEDAASIAGDSVFDLLGYIRVHNRFARVQSQIQGPDSSTGDDRSEVAETEDETIESVNTVSAFKFFDTLSKLEHAAKTWPRFAEDDGKEAKEARKGCKKRFMTFFQAAVREYDSDAEKIANETFGLTMLNLDGIAYGGAPVDMHSLLQSSIRPFAKSDQSSQGPQSAVSSGVPQLTLDSH